MSSLINEFAEAETGVFWDIVDCEIPNGVSLDLVCENIKSSLADDGYRGKVSIRAYCDTKESKVSVASAFKSSRIKLVRAGDTNSRLIRMLKDLTLFAVDHKPSNLMVISQDISTESVYVKHLNTVKKRNHNLLLAQIDKVKGELLTSVSSIWYWTDLANGGVPAFQSTRSCRVDDTSTSGSSQGVANKRTSSTNESIQGPKRLRIAESTHSVVLISRQGPEEGYYNPEA